MSDGKKIRMHSRVGKPIEPVPVKYFAAILMSEAMSEALPQESGGFEHAGAMIEEMTKDEGGGDSAGAMIEEMTKDNPGGDLAGEMVETGPQRLGGGRSKVSGSSKPEVRPRDDSVVRSLLRSLEKSFGQIDFLSAPYPFDMTDYYSEEMGGGLVRRFVSFERLSSPADIVRFKLESRRIEEAFVVPAVETNASARSADLPSHRLARGSEGNGFAEGSPKGDNAAEGSGDARGFQDIKGAETARRLFNIDPGYIDFFKVVLASFKEGPHKVYIGRGVYADPVLLYHEGTLEPFEWSFADFKSRIYNSDLLKIRRLYKSALKRSR